jgi:omega-6 fatty acid desaturase (delta-12 desaturase)
MVQVGDGAYLNKTNQQIAKPGTEERGWREIIAPYRNSNAWRSISQLVTTVIPFIVIFYLMYLSFGYSYWITLAISPLAAGFQLRLFIIFHDCCHLSFFKSQKANAIVGSVLGVVVFTPYYHWRFYHAIHHATTGNLTKRLEGTIVPLTVQKYMQTNGDVLTLTVKEYVQLSGKQQLLYRLYRWFILFLVVTPLLVFLVMHRLANSQADKRARYSVYGTNLALAVVILILSLTLGFFPFVLITLPVLAMSATVGVWLFYIQHQFEETYWEASPKWNYVDAAMQGSSFYKLPLILQWFTGNIGYHHIHHLNPRIPNYNLQKCHESSEFFGNTKALTLMTGLKSIFFRLWDEDERKMVGFRSSSVKVVQKEVLNSPLTTSLTDEN